MNRENMIWILLLICLTSTVCGFVVKRTQTFYEAEEKENVTIRWDTRTKADMSLTNLVCFLHSKPLKVLFEMVNSVEVPESQDEQFAGRVQCDEDALREGRIRLHLSGVTADDSGNYWCDLAAGYDKTTRRWTLLSTEHFALNVTSHGDNSDELLTTPELPEGTTHTPGGPKEEEVRSFDWNQVKTALGAANVGVLVVAGLLFLLAEAPRCLTAFVCQCQRSHTGWKFPH